MENQQTRESLYQKRIPIFPRSVRGKFRRFRTSVLVAAYIVYFFLPWLPWQRTDAAHQAVLFDLVGRRFFIFNLAIYPQDIIALSLLLFIAAVTLFFVTGLVGRAFCGYFCFQTLWTDAYIFIERWVQGERPARIRLNKQPWNTEKIWKYALTHLLWLALAFLTGLSFILYFGYAPSLLREFFSGSLPSVAYATVLILTLTTYVAAGWMREQVCMYMCPYARFQSVMYEPETLVVTYETSRGEGSNGRVAVRPGLRSREERQAAGHGDCIDCGFCAQVCPAGIDIRDGLQYQCISCGLCVDACNHIMDSMKFPRGLIRYDSEINRASGQAGKPNLSWLRLRTVGYGGFIVLMTALLVYTLATRTSFEYSVRQVRQPLYVQLTTGEIRNRYQIRLTNKTDHAQVYRFSAQGVPASALVFGEANTVKVRAGKTIMVMISVKLPPEKAIHTQYFNFIITPEGDAGEMVRARARFYAKLER